MSLINDALKKAARTQPAGQPAPTPPPVPVAEPQGEDPAGFWTSICLAFVLGFAIFLLWEWFTGGHPAFVRARSTAVVAPAARLPAPTQAAAPAPAPNPPPVPPINSKTDPAPTNSASTAIEPFSDLTAIPDGASPTPVVVEPPKPAPVVHKLQGILFRPGNPSAVVDGKTVFVGTRLNDARVILIEQDAVTLLTASGQTNLLALP